jgi:hypothetical protein
MPRRRSGQLRWADTAVTQTQGRRRDRLREIDGLRDDLLLLDRKIDPAQGLEGGPKCLCSPSTTRTGFAELIAARAPPVP